ncbi:sulfotransferase [Marinicella sp. W31]|uniref:sulfotransferase n=1 Tax=Marinicella sp. W31 TaxID=3023713 RepID=UPI0037573812
MSVSLTKNDIHEIDEKISTDQISAAKTLVIFVGHAHSGHSLIGALLDAHPDAAISNHLNIPKLIRDHTVSEHIILKTILAQALGNIDDQAWNNTGYSYRIPDSYQGKTKRPLVIGDKQGGASTRIIRKNPELLQSLQDKFSIPIKFVHVCRNMYDNIAAFAHYWGDDQVEDKHVERYFENLETTLSIQNKIPTQDFITLEHEAFVQSPEQHLEKLYQFLGLDIDSEYIQRLCTIVNPSSHQRRNNYTWPDTLMQKIYRLKKSLHP